MVRRRSRRQDKATIRIAVFRGRDKAGRFLITRAIFDVLDIGLGFQELLNVTPGQVIQATPDWFR